MSEKKEPHEFMPIFRYASERDVDVLIVEELISSRDFMELMFSRAVTDVLPSQITNWDVKHSTSRIFSRREIDIRLLVRLKNNKQVCLLIENKLDTSEQPEQGESYKAECKELSKNGYIAVCGLIAPSSYIEKYDIFARKFDFVLSYEDIREAINWRIHNIPDLDEEIVARLRHRSTLLTQAIDKQRRGYTQIILPEKATFNQRYVELVRQLAPDCFPGAQMLRTDGNPAESVSMLFDARGTFAAMPEEIRPRRFAHEFGRGQTHRANYVAVTFAQWGSSLKKLKEKLTSDLKDTPYQLLAKVSSSRPNPGLVLYEPTQPISYDKGFEEAQPKLEKGILRAEALRAWIIDNQPLLKRWFKLIQSART